MTRTGFVLLMLTVAAAGCGAGKPAVKPDDMSAAEHRSEAAREKAEAGEHARRYEPGAAVANPVPPIGPAGEGDFLFSTSVYNPTDTHLRQADEHRAHARQHEKAAQALEKFEEAECRGFPPSTRAACPLLGPVMRIEDIPGGVRATLLQGTRVDAVVAHMRCHYAYARARGFAESVSCPLYMSGVEIRRSPDGAAVEITTPEAGAVGELRGRAREEAVYVRGGRR